MHLRETDFFLLVAPVAAVVEGSDGEVAAGLRIGVLQGATGEVGPRVWAQLGSRGFEDGGGWTGSGEWGLMVFSGRNKWMQVIWKKWKLK